MTEDDYEAENARRLRDLFWQIQRDEYAQQERKLVDQIDSLKGTIKAVLSLGNLDANDVGGLEHAKAMLVRFEDISMNLMSEQIVDLGAQGRLMAQISLVLGSAFTAGQYSMVGVGEKPKRSKRDPARARSGKAGKVATREGIVWDHANAYWSKNPDFAGNDYQAVYGRDNIFSVANEALKTDGHRIYVQSSMQKLLKRMVERKGEGLRRPGKGTAKLKR